MRRRVVLLVASTVLILAAWLQMGDSMPSWLSLASPPPTGAHLMPVVTSAIS